MTKQFSLLQLFSIVDGRLSTSMDDVYAILNHITDDNLMTHHLPVASRYMKQKSPKWLQIVSAKLAELDATTDVNFEDCIEILKEDKTLFDIPQLKDEFNTEDFVQFMIDGSLLKGKEVLAVQI